MWLFPSHFMKKSGPFPHQTKLFDVVKPLQFISIMLACGSGSVMMSIINIVFAPLLIRLALSHFFLLIFLLLHSCQRQWYFKLCCYANYDFHKCFWLVSTFHWCVVGSLHIPLGASTPFHVGWICSVAALSSCFYPHWCIRFQIPSFSFFFHSSFLPFWLTFSISCDWQYTYHYCYYYWFLSAYIWWPICDGHTSHPDVWYHSTWTPDDGKSCLQHHHRTRCLGYPWDCGP